MGLNPKRSRRTGRIETEFMPPCCFITMTMDLAMMSAAERDRELIADSSAERSVLRKAQMVRIAGLTAADQTGLLGNKAHMVAIANSSRLWVRQHRLIDRRWWVGGLWLRFMSVWIV